MYKASQPVDLFKKKNIFDDAANEAVVKAIQQAESMTSGEVRVYVEQKCKYVDPMDRAKEVFEMLNMQKTEARNGVLVYVAFRDRQLAILGDEGIHQKVGDDFWRKQLAAMREAFRKEQYVPGITAAVRSIGDSLKTYFPHQRDDRNELPDNIVYG